MPSADRGLLRSRGPGPDGAEVKHGLGPVWHGVVDQAVDPGIALVLEHTANVGHHGVDAAAKEHVCQIWERGRLGGQEALVPLQKGLGLGNLGARGHDTPRLRRAGQPDDAMAPLDQGLGDSLHGQDVARCTERVQKERAFSCR
ncbi:uncharacterized protein PpBr36_10873 [Pyricularia pennisetigena]|uniref:uncharacterized protein n=1 Tax=Pyricularia pennisetigena TaxID=1578925 RepID=UPI001153ABFD|nr:uncharacterized protein PpBr36_10873 [Pyricularia pennisetigena]TLS20958.1 hypothetical protein PpBr36_10873 [Pyricularia pennisetigena]